MTINAKGEDASLRNLVVSLASQGIRLWTDGNKLHYVGAPEQLTPKSAAQLRAQRSALSELLRREGATQPGWPATAAQQSLWFTSTLRGRQDCAHHLLTALELRADVQPQVLEDALIALVARQESLRTRFVMQFGRLWQLIQPTVEPVLSHQSIAVESEDALHAWIASYSAAPFDLEHGPLFRSCLLEVNKVAERCRILVFNVHHVAVDFPALQALLAELSEMVSGRTPAHPQTPFRSHAALLERRTAANLQDQCCAFVQHLTPLPDAVQLGNQVRRRTDHAADYQLLAWQPISAQATALLALCRQWEMNPFVLCLSMFTLVVARVGAQSRLVVNVATRVSGDHVPATLIGNLANLTPLLVEVDGEQTLRQAIECVAASWQFSAAHADVPFAELVEHLGLSGQSHRCPISPIAFAWHRDLASVAHAQQQLGRVLPISRQLGPPGELLMTGHQSADGLDFKLVYDQRTLRADLVLAIADGMNAMIGAVLTMPARVLRTLPLVPGSGINLHGIALTEAVSPLCDRILKLAARSQAPAAVRWSGGTLTPAELRNGVAGVAQTLRNRGVVPGDRIGVALRRGPALLAAALGIWHAGCVYVPIDAEYPPQRREQLLALAGAVGIISDEPAAAVDAPWWHWRARSETLFAFAGELPPAPVLDPESAAYIIFTSGSTGVPKGVVISHGALAHFIEAFVRKVGLSRHNRYLAVSSISFDASVVELFAPLAVGAVLSISDDGQLRDPESVERLMQYHCIDMMQATPSFWRTLLLAFPDRRWNLQAHSMGEALPMELARRMHTCFNSVWNLYGPTEATVYVTANKVDIEAAADCAHAPITEALAGNALLVLDPWGHPVANGVIGELYLAGPQLALGYWNDPVRTAEAFASHSRAQTMLRLYRTGDLARHTYSSHIELLGRRDHQIKLRGHRIELGELEAQLCLMDGVDDAAVCVESRGNNEHLVAFITGPATAIEVERRLARRLPRHLLPTRFIKRDQLIVNGNGKTDRLALLASVEAALPPAAVAIGDSVHSQLFGILSNLLGCTVSFDRADVTLFDLGVDSISAVEFCLEVRSVLHCELAVAELFEHPTVNSLSRLLGPRLQWPTADTEDTPCDYRSDQMLPVGYSPTQPRPRQVRRVFLTGATGYLGSRVLHTLLQEGPLEVICLVRASDDTNAFHRLKQTLADNGLEVTAPQLARIRTKAGNMSLADFGLAKDDYAWLSTHVDTVIHCAALVNFALPYESLRGNVIATREIISFCGEQQAKRLHFVSTYSVLDPRADILEPILEVPEHDHLDFGYARSKWVCERLLLRAIGQGLACRIYRPSRIVSGTPAERINSADFYSLVLAASLASGTSPERTGADNFVGVRGVARCIASYTHRVFDDACAVHTFGTQWTPWSEITGLMAQCGFPTRATSYASWVEAASEAIDAHPGLVPFIQMLPFLTGAGNRLREAFSQHLPRLPVAEPEHATDLDVRFDTILIDSHLRQILQTNLSGSQLPLPSLNKNP